MKPLHALTSGLFLLAAGCLPASAQALRLSPAPAAPMAPMPVAAYQDGSGWYLRGDVGINKNTMGDLKQDNLTQNGGSFISQSLTNSASLGVGVGYRFSPNIRFDATWEMRSGANLRAVDNVRITNARGQTAADIYTIYNGNLHSQVALVNGYFDIGTWNGLTPFVGLSVGVARNSISGLTTTGHAMVNTYSNVAPFDLTGQLLETTGGYARDKSRYSFAWGVTGGLGYAVNENLTLEMAYRYLNLGSTAETSLIHCTCGTVGTPLKLGNLGSHDVKLGMRWNFNETPRAIPQAIRTRY